MNKLWGNDDGYGIGEDEGERSIEGVEDRIVRKRERRRENFRVLLPLRTRFIRVYTLIRRTTYCRWSDFHLIVEKEVSI